MRASRTCAEGCGISAPSEYRKTQFRRGVARRPGDPANNTSSQSSAEKSNTTLRPANGSSASGEDCELDLEFQLQQGTTGSDWTTEELAILESALAKYPADKVGLLLRRVRDALLDQSAPLAAVWPFHLWDGRSVANPCAQALPPPDMSSIHSLKPFLSIFTASMTAPVPPACSRQYPAVERYIHVAASLPSKTARDVALRVKACNLDGDKGRKGAGDDGGKRKGGVAGLPPRPSQQAGGRSGGGVGGAGAGGAGGAASAEDASSHGSGVPVALTQLMESNYSILAQFKANMAAFKVMENTELLMRYRDNLVAIQQQLSTIGGIMGQMPPLPVQPNFDLANKFLPPPVKPPGAPGVPPALPGLPGMVPPPPMPVPPVPPVPALPPPPMPAAPPPAVAPAPVAPGAPSPVPPAPSPAPPHPGFPPGAMPLMPPFPFSPTAPGMPQPPGMPPPMMPPGVQLDPASFFGAGAAMPGMPGMPGLMPPGMLPGGPGMAPGMPGAPGAFPFPMQMGAPGGMPCMPMPIAPGAVPGAPGPPPMPGAPNAAMPDGGAAAAAAAAAAVAAAAAAAQQAAGLQGMPPGLMQAGGAGAMPGQPAMPVGMAVKPEG